MTEDSKRFVDRTGGIWEERPDSHLVMVPRNHPVGPDALPIHRDIVEEDLGPLVEIAREQPHIDAAVEVAARAIADYQARNCYPAEQYTWEAIPQDWRDNHLAAARVMVTAVVPVLAAVQPALSALTVHDNLVAAKPGDVFSFEQAPDRRVLVVVASAQFAEPGPSCRCVNDTAESCPVHDAEQVTA